MDCQMRARKLCKKAKDREKTRKLDEYMCLYRILDTNEHTHTTDNHTNCLYMYVYVSRNSHTRINQQNSLCRQRLCVLKMYLAAIQAPQYVYVCVEYGSLCLCACVCVAALFVMTRETENLVVFFIRKWQTRKTPSLIVFIMCCDGYSKISETETDIVNPNGFRGFGADPIRIYTRYTYICICMCRLARRAFLCVILEPGKVPYVLCYMRFLLATRVCVMLLLISYILWLCQCMRWARIRWRILYVRVDAFRSDLCVCVLWCGRIPAFTSHTTDKKRIRESHSRTRLNFVNSHTTNSEHFHKSHQGRRNLIFYSFVRQ